MLNEYILNERKTKDILLMTHIVIGYPSLEGSYELVRTMVEAGVELMELQIPFSEPIADGPVILKANHAALEKGMTVAKCLEFASLVSKEFPIPFLFMSYYNILYRYGVEKFVNEMTVRDVRGAIVPDLPPEEGADYLEAMKRRKLDPIFIYSPTSPDMRMKMINDFASGFIYCVARKGVTGRRTEFSGGLDEYLSRCRKATSLPLALGFGVKEKTNVDYLKGKVDIAIIGTQTIKVAEEKGIEAVGGFIKSLR